MILRRVEEAFKYIMLTILLADIASFLFSIPLGFYLTSTLREGIEFARKKTTPYLLFLLISVRLPFSVERGWLLIGLLTLYSLCFLSSYYLNESTSSVISSFKRMRCKSIFSNWLLSMPIISSLLLFVIILLQSFQEAHGVPTGSIEFQNPFEALIGLAYSPLVEEVGFRVIPIGTTITAHLYQVNRRRGVGMPLRFYINAWLFPEKGKMMAGLKTLSNDGLKGVASFEWFSIILTSILFGLAHYLFGGGWDVGKVSSAFIAGFSLALIFIFYGAPAAILAHWYFNYYGYVYQLAQDYYATVFSPIVSIIDTLTIIVGAMGLGLIASSAYRDFPRLRKRRIRLFYRGLVI